MNDQKRQTWQYVPAPGDGVRWRNRWWVVERVDERFVHLADPSTPSVARTRDSKVSRAVWDIVHSEELRSARRAA